MQFPDQPLRLIGLTSSNPGFKKPLNFSRQLALSVVGNPPIAKQTVEQVSYAGFCAPTAIRIDSPV